MTFSRTDGVLHADGVPLTEIAERVGTPTYVYSRGLIEARFEALSAGLQAVPHQLCYAVKANSNLRVLQVLGQLGAGFDIVSGGELLRVVAAGGDPASVVFSGVGKTTAELDLALKHGVGCFNVESAAELSRLGDRARLMQTTASVAVRVNPDIDAQTHPYISTGLRDNKFGVPVEQVVDLYRQIARHEFLHASGIACHIGSQISSVAPFDESLQCLLGLVDELHDLGIDLDHVDVGGGLGISYQNEPLLDVAAYGAAMAERLSGRPLKLMAEPGRFIVGDAGVLLTRVEYLKPQIAEGYRSFAVVDAAMNDLIRPALYQAWHDVERVTPAAAGQDARGWDIVGPVCESGDFLAKDRTLALEEGALLAVRATGAYGMVQSSNYNSRGRAAEVMAHAGRFDVIRRRETLRDQLALELEALSAEEFDAAAGVQAEMAG